MKGKWKAYSQYFEGKAEYIAGRQLDVDQPLHGGNIEHCGGYSANVREIESLCLVLNEKEEKGVTDG